MEENTTNMSPAPQNSNMSKGLGHNFYKDHPRTVKAIIISAIILLAVLVTLYFLNRRPAPAYQYTVEEKVEQMQDVVKKTQEQGVPDKKKQIDIMNYNKQQ